MRIDGTTLKENIDFKNVPILIPNDCRIECSSDIACAAYEYNTTTKTCRHWYKGIKGDDTPNDSY